MSTSTEPTSKRPRRQCVKCLCCSRTGKEAQEQENDPDNHVPTGDSCQACSKPTFHLVRPDVVEYDRYGEVKLTSLCFDFEFDEALKRVRCFPKEANSLPKKGHGKPESALHWAVYNDAPTELIRELVRAGPDMLTFDGGGWHSQGNPLDIVLRSRRYFFVAPDTLERVKILVEGNKKVASLSLFTAFCRLGTSLINAVDDLEKYHDRVPADCSFIEEYPEDLAEGEKGKMQETTSLNCQEQLRMMLDIFSFIAKVSYYDTLDCEDLPLTHALAAFPYEVPEDELNWTSCPDKALLVAYRFKPEELSMPDADGNLPLHLAAAHREPHRKKDKWELQMEREYVVDIDYCLQEYGESWLLDELPEEEDRQKDDYDGFNYKKIEMLLEAYPEALQSRNGDGDLPIHVAIKARKSHEIVVMVLSAFPEAISAADSDGNTCLHLVAQQMPGALNIKQKIDEYVVQQNLESPGPYPRRRLQGHHFISADKKALIEELVEKHPEACAVRNNEGKLPFQYFMENEVQNHADNVQLFLTDEAAMSADNETGLLGFMIAASSGNIDLSYRMLQTFPSVMEQWRSRG